jgi:hypothetical protein
MRGATLLTVILASGIGLAVFLLEYRVKDLENQLQVLDRAIVAERVSIRVLEAEWSHLNDPARLGAMAARLLGMEPVAPGQLTSMAELSQRVPDARDQKDER